MSKCSQVFAAAGTLVLIFAFQNCATDQNDTPSVVVDTSSTFPNPTPGAFPSPAPSLGPGTATGPNPMPLGLKATFRGGNVLRVGANQFPLDLTMVPAQTIEVDISSHDTAYLSNPVNAIPNDDYVPFSGQTITFNPGEVTKGVTVQLLKFSGKYFLFSAANCKYGGVPFSCVYLF